MSDSKVWFTGLQAGRDEKGCVLYVFLFTCTSLPLIRNPKRSGR